LPRIQPYTVVGSTVNKVLQAVHSYQQCINECDAWNGNPIKINADADAIMRKEIDVKENIAVGRIHQIIFGLVLDAV